MAVIEALMLLYIRELVEPARVSQAVKRFTKNRSGDDVPQEPEEALIYWVNESCQSLRKKLDETKKGSETFLPKLTKCQDLSDFSDGVGLTTVIAFYCPDELLWSEISVGDPPSMSDSLCNIQLFQRFCVDALPFNICYLSMEDIFYLHSSIKLVLQCLLADLFSVLETRPVKCVDLPGLVKEKIIEVPDPDRLKSPSRSNGNQSFQSDREDSDFVVQRGRSIPTLANVNNSHRSISPASDLGQKERLNQDTKSEERGETETSTVARSNSIYDQNRNPGVAGRPSEPRSLPIRSRSRRNSVSENFESQICIENIGGSTDNLSMVGRNPDKEMKVHSGRRSESDRSNVGSNRRGSSISNQQTFDIRKLGGDNPNNDVQMFIDNKDLDAMEKHEREGSPFGGKSSQHVNLNSSKDERDRKTSFADLRRKSQTQNLFATSGINITYCDGDEKEDPPKRNSSSSSIRQSSDRDGLNNSGVRSQGGGGASGGGDDMNDKLNSVRVKLEERRKRIEEEKRKMEQVMSRQERQTGQERQEGGYMSPDTSTNSALGSSWLSDRNRSDHRTPDRFGSPGPGYRGDTSEPDLGKMASQQSQIQRMMQQPQQQQYNNIQSPPPQQQQPLNPMDPQPFYITGDSPHHPQVPPQQPHTPRRTWGQPQPINFGQGGPMNPYGPRPMYGGPYGAPQYDQYGNPIIPRDQWGNPLPPQAPMYNGGQYPDQYGGYGQPGPYGPYGQQPYYGQQQQQQSPYGPSTYSPMTSPGGPGAPGPRTPFRLHESPGPGLMSPARSSYDLSDPAAAASTPRQAGFSRHASREQLAGAGVTGTPTTELQNRRLHTSVPAPAADDMAPQNVSFIENSTDNDEDNEDKSTPSPTPEANGSYQEAPRSDSNLSERLKRLNISRGDKTYRIQLHADGREPTTLDSDSPSSLTSRPSSRPTISSTFKDRRRESGESSGPGSLSGPGSMTQPAVQTKLTDDEINTLNSMKTEVLKETGDPTKGFVISFDDDAPVKPKPALRPKRLSIGSKKNSREEKHDPVMIMLDMNEDADSDNIRDVSPIRKLSPNKRLNSFNGKHDNRLGSPTKYVDSNQWNNYGEDSMRSPDDPVLPKFEVDPEVPLEPMLPLDNGGTGSDSDSARPPNTGMIIGDEVLSNNTDQSEMAKRKERIMLQSLRRQQQNEENRIKREEATRRKKDEEQMKAEESERKKEEDRKRKEAILEAYKAKKEQEKAEEEGRRFPEPVSAKPVPKIRPSPGGLRKPRPKTIHVDKNDVNLGARRIRGSTSNLRGSSSNLSNIGASNNDLRRSESRGSLADERQGSSRSTLSLANMGSRPPMGGSRTPSYARTTAASSRRGSTQYLNEDVGDSPRSSRADRSARSMSQPRGKRDSSVSSAYAQDRGPRNDSFRGSRESLTSRRTYTARSRRGSNASLYDDEEDYYYGGSLRDMNYGGHSGRARKSSSTNYLGPGSLPSRHRGDYDDGASDVSSQASGWSRYSYGGGQRLFREPQLKTNRPIVMNALEHAVFPGAVNKDVRERVMDEIDACDCPHFLVLFRDSKCQFRGLYAYYPDTEEVFKIYGTGPKQVTENMFDKYFKYNSGGKKFTQIHTKSLSVTIDAFTIQNSLWLGKKTKLPDKRGMPLVM